MITRRGIVHGGSAGHSPGAASFTGAIHRRRSLKLGGNLGQLSSPDHRFTGHIASPRRLTGAAPERRRSGGGAWRVRLVKGITLGVSPLVLGRWARL